MRSFYTFEQMIVRRKHICPVKLRPTPDAAKQPETVTLPGQFESRSATARFP
jgi:hypothetical protein